MMVSSLNNIEENMKQIATGINGLDKVLEGGFLRPSIVLIAGIAGTGKTTLAMQSIFNAARNEEICMYVVALSEPIAMINNFMSRFSFYNISLLGKGYIKYVPVDIDVIHKGPKAIIEEMEKSVETIRPDRIVIDPINVFTMGQDEESRRRFYYDFFISMKSWNSHVLLTGEFNEEELERSILSYLVDGTIYLDFENSCCQNRYLNVLKMRGQNFQGGKHSFKITKDGISVFARLSAGKRKSYTKEHISTGIKGLDQMTAGGFLKGSAILISGSSGLGKTMIGMRFIIEGLLKNEAGIIISFEEDALQIRENSRIFCKDIEGFEKKGLLKIFSSLDFEANEFALQLDEIIERSDTRRLLFDGTARLAQMLPQFVQYSEYITNIINTLRNKNITAIYTNESSNLTGATQITGIGLSQAMDTIILLRYVEIKSEMRKAISVLKMRGSNHEK
ncbi:MAG TPA: ATPase domain-containing protein, partial [Candidatus Methanoperedens sp.]